MSYWVIPSAQEVQWLKGILLVAHRHCQLENRGRMQLYRDIRRYTLEDYNM